MIQKGTTIIIIATTTATTIIIIYEVEEQEQEYNDKTIITTVLLIFHCFEGFAIMAFSLAISTRSTARLYVRFSPTF